MEAMKRARGRQIHNGNGGISVAFAGEEEEETP